MMDAFILSAGLGTRMRPLTNDTPKPLLMVGKYRLIEHHIINLRSAGISRIVINVSYKAEKIQDTIGDGSAYGVDIAYSFERESPLGTGGGIRRAIPLIHSENFIVVSADAFTNYPFQQLELTLGDKACLVLVDNPKHHSNGDFMLVDGRVIMPIANSKTLTYSGIATLSKSLFTPIVRDVFSLYEVFKNAIKADEMGGLYYQGLWFDVGTPQRLRDVNSLLDSGNLEQSGLLR